MSWAHSCYRVAHEKRNSTSPSNYVLLPSNHTLISRRSCLFEEQCREDTWLSFSLKITVKLMRLVWGRFVEVSMNIITCISTDSDTEGRGLHLRRETKRRETFLDWKMLYRTVVILKCAYFPIDHSNVSLWWHHDVRRRNDCWRWFSEAVTEDRESWQIE